MSILAFCLVLSGTLKLILEFGSITFLIVSLLIAFANFKVRVESKSSTLVLLIAIFLLSLGTFFILYYEFVNEINQMYFILFIYVILTLGAFYYSKK